jgi:hypothetical protein
MALRSVCVMRGVNKPFDVDETSKIADGSGVAPLVLIPTF